MSRRCVVPRADDKPCRARPLKGLDCCVAHEWRYICKPRNLRAYGAQVRGCCVTGRTKRVRLVVQLAARRRFAPALEPEDALVLADEWQTQGHPVAVRVSEAAYRALEAREKAQG